MLDDAVELKKQRLKDETGELRQAVTAPVPTMSKSWQRRRAVEQELEAAGSDSTVVHRGLTGGGGAAGSDGNVKPLLGLAVGLGTPIKTFNKIAIKKEFSTRRLSESSQHGD